MLQVVAAAGGAVWAVDADAVAEHPAAGGPLAALAASPDGRFVAGLAATGELTVWTADFGRALTRHDTGAAGKCTNFYQNPTTSPVVPVASKPRSCRDVGPSISILTHIRCYGSEESSEATCNTSSPAPSTTGLYMGTQCSQQRIRVC